MALWCKLVLGVGGLALLAAGGDSDRVKVTVVGILASESGHDVDPRLKLVAEEVSRLNPQLKSFKLDTMESQSLAVDEKAAFRLIDGKTVKVVVKHAADKNNRVCLAVIPPDQREIVYRTVCGKFLPIVTRHQTKNKERLILAIRVEPCQGK